jgi:hypothetical protein
VAPAGTVTVSEVVDALPTVACVAPNQTILLPGVASKFVPVITTDDEGKPKPGLTLAIVGAPVTVEGTTIKERVEIQPPVVV